MNLKKSVIAAWSLFDFANSSFAMIMVTFVYPLYYAGVIVTDGKGDLYWGIAMSSSMLLVALIAPALGAIADTTRSKKKILFVFTFVAVIATAGTYFLQPGMIFLGALLFILGNAGFEGGIVFYDAFLPEISPPEKFGKVSGIGFAVGYLGSLAAIGATMNLLLAKKYPETFLVTAVMFAVFAIPIFLFVPEHRHEAKKYSWKIITDSFRGVIKTAKHIWQYRSLAIFLIAFFLYNDAILTVIGFSGLYAKDTLNFSTDVIPCDIGTAGCDTASNPDPAADPNAAADFPTNSPFSQLGTPNGATLDVPEPATIGVFGAVLTALGLARRRKPRD